MNEPTKSRFDLSQIGEADRHNLSATFLEAAQRFFNDPENLMRFKRWQEQRMSPASAAKV